MSSSPLLAYARIGICILIYYPLSILLTFYQKWLLKSFSFPLFIVLCHYVFKLLCAFLLRCRFVRVSWAVLRGKSAEKVTPPPTLPWSDYMAKMAPIGVAASVDIALSNWALEYITVSLYTMAKSTSIIFILLFGVAFGLEKFTTRTIGVIILITGGLVLFTYRSSQFSLSGFLLVEVACACAGLRWSLSQFAMQRMGERSLKNPVDMIYHVQPWMVLSVLPLVLVVEGKDLMYSKQVFSADDWDVPFSFAVLILGGGVLAMAMELAEYLLLSLTSGLTLNVCGIAKEIVSILLAHRYNGDELSLMNVLGLLVCIGGIALHVASKTQGPKPTPLAPPFDVGQLLDDATQTLLTMSDSEGEEDLIYNSTGNTGRHRERVDRD